MSDPIYVVGHRGPDTDAICSAIAHARLKRSLGDDAVAARPAGRTRRRGTCSTGGASTRRRSSTTPRESG